MNLKTNSDVDAFYFEIVFHGEAYQRTDRRTHRYQNILPAVIKIQVDRPINTFHICVDYT